MSSDDTKFRSVAEQMRIRGSKSETLHFRHVIYEGLLLPSMVDVDLLSDLQANFEVRPGDVFLVTYPKSGTFWISQIVRGIVGPQLPATGYEPMIGNDVPFYEITPRALLERFPSPRCMFTHLPFSMVPRSPAAKYVCLARNPRDVAVSYFHFMRLMRIMEWDGDWEEFLGYFNRGELLYGDYYDHILGCWEHRDDDNVLFLKYEDLKRDLEGQVRVVARFLERELTDEEVREIARGSTFEAMKARPETSLDQFAEVLFNDEVDGAYMRKGVVGDWQGHFSPEQLTEHRRIQERRMAGSGLEFAVGMG